MTFALGFICGVVLGAIVTHLAHEYMDAMLPKDEAGLWMGKEEEQKLWMKDKE